MQSNFKQFLALLFPSWLSGIFVIATAFVATVSVLLNANSRQNVLQDGLNSAHSFSGPAYQQTVDLFAKSAFISSLPLILLYAAVGAVIYLVAVHIIEGLRDTAELTQTMNYINGHKSTIVVSTLARLVIRVVVISAWLAYSIIFIKVIIPKFLTLAHVVVPGGTFQTAVNTLLAGLLLAVAVHVHVIMVRLFLLRRISRW